MSKTHEVTELLLMWRGGNQEALDKLVPIVQLELHLQDAKKLDLNKKVVLLQPTALVNEVFVALLGLQEVDWQNRAHFFGMAATLMRNILIDYIRKERKSVEIPLDEGDDVPQARHLDVEALHDALNSLAEIDSRASQTVELRFFAGLTQEEIAEVTGMSLRNVQRKWSYARAWLSRELTRK